jgi:hypothetical protein
VFLPPRLLGIPFPKRRPGVSSRWTNARAFPEIRVEDGHDRGMTDFPRLAFGTAVLARERLFGRARADTPIAIALGLAAQGREGAVRVVARLRRPVVKAPSLRQALHDAGARGAIVMSRSRRDAESALREVMDDSVGWAEKKVVPKVVEDMMPYIVNTLVPKVIDGVMPQVREKVLPVLIDDLSRDPKVRKLITDQSQSAVSEAASELRETSEGADDRLEAAFNRITRR